VVCNAEHVLVRQKFEALRESVQDRKSLGFELAVKSVPLPHENYLAAFPLVLRLEPFICAGVYLK